MSKSRIFFIVIGVFVAGMIAFGWWQSRLKTQRVEAERAEEAAAADRKAKAEAERRRIVQASRTERDDELRQNTAERLRLQRRYPESYEALEQRAGGDISRCVVTAMGEQRGENQGDRTPTLRARCGEALDKNF